MDYLAVIGVPLFAISAIVALLIMFGISRLSTTKEMMNQFPGMHPVLFGGLNKV